MARRPLAAFALACAAGFLVAPIGAAELPREASPYGECVPKDGPTYSGHAITVSFAAAGCNQGVFFKIACDGGDVQLRFASPSDAPWTELAYSWDDTDDCDRLWAVSVRGTTGPDTIDVSRVRTAYIGPHSHIKSFNGDDVIQGTSTNDRIVTGPRGSGRGDRDMVWGNGGLDRIFSGRDRDRVKGGNQRDRLRGGSADDVLLGEFENDTIEGNAGDDRLVGGPGRDTFPNPGGDEVIP